MLDLKLVGPDPDGLPGKKSKEPAAGSHHPLQGSVPLPDGPIWTPGQADSWDSVRSLADSEVGSGPVVCAP